jgi:hypothetical protein
MKLRPSGRLLVITARLLAPIMRADSPPKVRTANPNGSLGKELSDRAMPPHPCAHDLSSGTGRPPAHDWQPGQLFAPDKECP